MVNLNPLTWFGRGKKAGATPAEPKPQQTAAAFAEELKVKGATPELAKRFQQLPGGTRALVSALCQRRDLTGPYAKLRDMSGLARKTTTTEGPREKAPPKEGRSFLGLGRGRKPRPR